MIISKNPNIVGIYRLTMKTGSDNFRASAIQDIINILKNNNIKVVIYEPTLNLDSFDGYNIINNLDEFKNMCDIIIANRIEVELDDIEEKVYTRDIFIRD